MFRPPKLVCLAALLALAGCASILDEDGSLAMTPYSLQESGRIVIEARVNGRGPFAFAIDTGATISVVFDRLRDELELDVVPGKTLRIHGLTASGEFPFLRIETLSVGREVWTEPRIASLPGVTNAGADIHGLLGVDFLRRYAVGFSAPDRVIRLYPPDLVSRREFRGWSTVPLQSEAIGDSGASLYFLELSIGSHVVPAIFDLGAGLNLLNHAAASAIGVRTSGPRQRDVVSGALETAPISARFRIDEIVTGRVVWRDEEFGVADLDFFTSLMRNSKPYALVGAGLFTQRDFIIDFVRNRLLVKVSMDETSAMDASAN